MEKEKEWTIFLDEYFMGWQCFPGCGPRILIHRWEPVL